jgi:hypothetical protein
LGIAEPTERVGHLLMSKLMQQLKAGGITEKHYE